MKRKKRRKKRSTSPAAAVERGRGPSTAELEASLKEAEAPETAEFEASLTQAQPPLGPEFEAALVENQSASRRQYARFFVGGKTMGKVTAVCDAVILNISVGGSLIEHNHVVRPGAISLLDLDLLGKRLSLRCRVARSVVARTEMQSDGEKELIFHTGLEFLHPSEETRKVISHYIQSIICDGNKIQTEPEEARTFELDEPPEYTSPEDAT